MSTFAGKGALIIGAGQNIGQKIALEFGRCGARIAVADINEAGARETAAMIEAAGGSAIGIGVDVTSEPSLADAVAAAEAFLGTIDIHMNNAGLLHSGHIQDFPPAEWERMFGVNLFGAVRANALVLPGMIARGAGHIVNTASFAGLYPYATNRIPYAASKAALISMSENMAIYLEPLGVRVSCLCPGPTMTTSIAGMRTFGENVAMRGPGADLAVKSQEEVAVILADAMEAGRILVPTHEKGWQTIREHAADPDAFVRGVAADFEAGKNWLPRR
jgi:NAD(P)-dependent dehydrogenase (short-subunit alcohol dehydrogenase family)